MAPQAAMSDASDPFFCLEGTNLISRREYRVKGNLETLAEEVLAGLETAVGRLPQEDDNSGPSDLIAQYNLAALLEFQYGQPARASDLSNKTIAICFQLHDRTSSLRWLGEAFQPFINLGRIAGALGDLEGALDRLGRLFRFITERERFEMNGRTIEPEKLLPPPGSESPRLAIFYEAYLQDWIKAHLLCGRYAELLDFLQAVEPMACFSAAGYQRSIAEARIRALINLHRTPEAIREAELLERRLGSGDLPPAIGVVCSEAWRRGGHLTEARKALAQVVELASQVDRESAMERRRFHFLVGIERFHLDQIAEATGHLQTALDLNLELGDEPGGLKSSILLMRCALRTGDLATADRWSEQVHRIASGTRYRQEQALAFYELAGHAVATGRDERAAQFLHSSWRIVDGIGTLDANQLSRACAKALPDRHGPAQKAWEMPSSPLIDTVYRRFMELDLG